MTKEQFKKHLQEHGITKARNTEECEDIPKGTELWFGLDDGVICTCDKYTRNKNQAYHYDFDYEWYYGMNYTGEFELVEEENKIYINGQDISKPSEEMFKGKITLISTELITATTIANQNYFILPKSNYTLEETKDLFIIKVK